MPASLSVSLKPSRVLLVLFVSIAALASLCVCLSRLPLVLQLAIIVGVAVSCGLTLRQHYFLRAGSSIHALRCRQHQWYLQLHSEEVAATLLPTSTLTNAVLVLNFRLNTSGRKFHLLLLPDSAAADSLRKLKAALRFANPHRSNLPV